MRTIVMLGLGAVMLGCGDTEGSSDGLGRDLGGLCGENEASFECDKCMAQGLSCLPDPLCNPYVCGPRLPDLSASSIDLAGTD
jgi:hypothetical protein